MSADEQTDLTCQWPDDNARGQHRSPITRRSFVGGAAALGVAASVVGLPWLLEPKTANAAEIGPTTGAARADQALRVRIDAAELERGQHLPSHPSNGDEDLYPNRIASFSKALPHNHLGEVRLDAYAALIQALTTGKPADFEAIPLGGVVLLRNPQAALAFELLGPDSHHLTVPAAPAFRSAERAAEMGELYWQAVTRDVPFAHYDANDLTQQAAADLSGFSDFRGPKVGHRVTTGTLFRGGLPGDLVGPYVSQFLLQDIPFGALPVTQQIRTAVSNVDFLTGYDDWLAIQNGASPTTTIGFDPIPRSIRNGRDLGEYVHRDFPYQAFLTACLILLGMNAPFDAGHPYRRSRTQEGFGTFGAPYVLDLVASVANRAIKAAWCQKWSVHRCLRPEEIAGRIHNSVTGRADYPIHEDILKSSALDRVFGKNGTYLLPQAYPEGCPIHPAYPAGHATFVGASCTVLKAFFDESFVIPDPVVASDDGRSRTPYREARLTVGGELNKLASNIAMGRDFAGIHYRSDALLGLKLGEAVAIALLTELKLTYNEAFAGFTLSRFDGSKVTV
ncbi:MAG: vanadium-dependent haloperoxidase [Chloroflexi bacterium]|nr:vanadium-dependent haloperoxidase [Chloroflexota bacterium]